MFFVDMRFVGGADGKKIRPFPKSVYVHFLSCHPGLVHKHELTCSSGHAPPLAGRQRVLAGTGLCPRIWQVDLAGTIAFNGFDRTVVIGLVAARYGCSGA